MASMLQHSWVSSFSSINPTSFNNKPTFIPSPYPSTFTRNPLKPSLSASLNQPGAESSQPSLSNSSQSSSEPEPGGTDPMKLAFARAKAYKKSVKTNPSPKIIENPLVEAEKNDDNVNGNGNADSNSSLGLGDGGGGNRDVPVSVKIAMEKAKEYKKNKGVIGGGDNSEEKETFSGLRRGNEGILEDRYSLKKDSEKKELTVSSTDFMGLNFSDKKNSRALPAGLAPLQDPFPEGDLPEVELIIGDRSNFGTSTPLAPDSVQEDDSDIYKPKVSTWGVFPRPRNISKSFGGGKVIRPGEVLETTEDKSVKEARTRELITAYQSKIGLNIDPRLRSECEKALKDGDSLMDLGKLKDALPYYEKVMDKLAFKSELHGLAALQWSICQDSLSRPMEAKAMYERLQSHPNVRVSKKARQFMFGFELMTGCGNDED
ncbi:uncharacterized protein LOC131164546 isoform X2 [Malania oleifera]|uniref:uncharacterized protein LOC131164546 isoform X2 n=1 Tax=Malania oleifera TaxID=397392 RepID=UPI0025AEAC54|nr:uncharacterized protein LOC131164546 isoform X2 [Malania oleifera]